MTDCRERVTQVFAVAYFFACAGFWAWLMLQAWCLAFPPDPTPFAAGLAREGVESHVLSAQPRQDPYPAAPEPNE